MTPAVAFWHRHHRAMTLAERIAHAETLDALEDLRLERREASERTGEAMWPDGEGLAYALRKAEIGKREARRG